MISRFCALLTLGLATVVPSIFASPVGPTYVGSDKACFSLIGSCGTTSGTMSYGFINKDLSFTTATINQVGNGDVKLGTFSLGTNPSIFAGSFDLEVTFTTPPGVNGMGDYDAILLGAVGFNDQGFAQISFSNPTSQTFTYPNGSFSLSLDQTFLSLCAGSSVDLTGTITGTSTITNASAAPEPMSMLLLGSGLGLIGLVRFRRTAKQ
jgi:hypothetical protein